MKKGNRELLVVGDRVLIEPEEAQSRTKVGLLLPPSVAEKEDVRGGLVVALGPGTPLPPPQDDTEPWKQVARAPRYIPMEVEVGDYALFFRKAAIEITFEDERYLVVPHGAILVLVRGAEIPDELPDDI
jgi:co-chaperonin GroES (HSP10)